MSHEAIANGSVTSPQGFLAGTTYIGLKTAAEGQRDLGLLYSTAPCVAAAVFAQVEVRSAHVTVDLRHLEVGRPRAIVVNSGCANAYTGTLGLANAERMTAMAAAKLGIPTEDVLAASTGVTGVHLAMDKVEAGIRDIVLSRNDHRFIRAMMTTDTFAKEIALRLTIDGATITIGGATKGAGMIHPNMATMLAFVTTDAAVERGFLQRTLRRIAAASFNMITVDGDTSPSDTLVVLANGLAGNAPLTARSRGARDFVAALTEVCTYLAKCIARDGEGATKFIEVAVAGARGTADARRIVRTIAGSSLVKSAIHGEDPNWGRILAAAARAGAALDENRVNVYLGPVQLMAAGQPLAFDVAAARAHLAGKDIAIRLELGLGSGTATAWGCDLSEEYVSFNSAYTT